MSTVEDVVYEPLQDCVNEEQAFLTKLRDTLKLLNEFKSSFDDQRAVCQAQIRTLINECNISLDDRYPVASFTTMPTSQNLTIATESVLARGSEVIVELVKKALEVLIKMVKWIIQTVKNLFARSKTTHQRIITIRYLSQATDELKSFAGGIDKLPKNDETKQAMEKYTKALGVFDINYNGVVGAMINEDPFIGALKSVSLLMPGLAKALGIKFQLVEHVLKNPSPDRLIASQQLADVTKPMPLDQLATVGKRFVPLAKATDLISFFEALKEHAYELHGQVRPHASKDWEITLKVILDQRSGFDEPIVQVPEAIEQAYSALNPKLDELVDLTEAVKKNDARMRERNGGMNVGLGAAYEQAMLSLLADVHSMAYYAETANLVLDSQYGIVNATLHLMTAEFEVYRAAAHSSGKEDLIQEVNRIQRTLREKITAR